MRFRPIPASRYEEEDSLAAIPATKMSEGVAPEMNLREHVTHMPPPSVNKATRLALKPIGDVSRSPKQGYQWPHKKDFCLQNMFSK